MTIFIRFWLSIKFTSSAFYLNLDFGFDNLKLLAYMFWYSIELCNWIWYNWISFRFSLSLICKVQTPPSDLKIAFTRHLFKKRGVKHQQKKEWQQSSDWNNKTVHSFHMLRGHFHFLEAEMWDTAFVCFLPSWTCIWCWWRSPTSEIKSWAY